ncbi:hypothetical protein M911_14125 [Ectothiorhodospira haloalkaliphila]|uniref:Transposase n=1 Tax=Ectothiorhodospira haloalkaliphila TaxID=421628 RepID=W8KLW2_9GAMM|nr:MULTISPECIES: hypothetical protein [Ectothiorhodospira]AHK80779.1 hypothetical protein M911_14125 [Ectothiorhodospira haloalkaliphila]MCG5495953.1 hypothetical protein [Ectothiorhodospira variabilis]MCG5498496.1 hypothetical protein [Ectothiorhodospira variabilis]MCG5505333.1 hypothetical protein [Ectothiorhodospira variabilis]MCG5508519.1 hypothetical protein [Ectothiorhodospira variabilis]
MSRGIQQRRRAFWQDLVRRWAVSGQSKAAFARQHGVSPRQLSQWAARYPEWVVVAAGPQEKDSSPGRAADVQRFLTVHPVEDEPAPAPTAVTEMTPSPQPGGPVVVALSNGCRLELHPGFCAQTLQRAMEVLEA